MYVFHLQGLVDGDDPLYQDAPNLARCVVNAATHPPLPPRPPPARTQPPFGSTHTPPPAPQLDQAWVGGSGSYGQQPYRGEEEALRVCHGVASQALLEALQQGAARAASR